MRDWILSPKMFKVWMSIRDCCKKMMSYNGIEEIGTQPNTPVAGLYQLQNLIMN